MSEEKKISFEDLAGNAAKQQMIEEFEKIVENLADMNTDAKARTMTVKYSFKPQKKEKRHLLNVDIEVSSSLRPTKAAETQLVVGIHEGKLEAIELKDGQAVNQLSFKDCFEIEDETSKVIPIEAQGGK